MCREFIAFELFTLKPGSKEHGKCDDGIAESLNGVKDVYCKVDQRALREGIKKLLKFHAIKSNREEKASGVEVEHSELNDLMLDVYGQHRLKESENCQHSRYTSFRRDMCLWNWTTNWNVLKKFRHSRSWRPITKNCSNNKRRSSGGDT